jgi:cell division protein FtsZ
MKQAELGIEELSKYVDSLIVIPNERLKQVEDTHITLANAFEIADDVLRRGVQSVSDLVNCPGFVNLDFADVTAIMKNAGFAHMGVGTAKGADKAQLAAMAAIKSPLLETSIAGARGVLVNITTSLDIQLEEVDMASQMIHEEAHPDANIIWGTTFDPDMMDEMRVTIIATGFDSVKDPQPSAPAAPVYAPAAPVAEAAPVAPVVEEPVYTAPAAPVYAPVAEQPAQEAPVQNAEPEFIPAQPIAQTSIPQPAPAKNAYQEYDNLFTCIKKAKKNI